jgi:hypothetical protein
MAVDIEDSLNAGMSESRCDDCRVGPLFDQEGHVAVSQIMESHRFPDGVSDSRLPVAASEGSPEGTSAW